MRVALAFLLLAALSLTFVFGCAPKGTAVDDSRRVDEEAQANGKQWPKWFPHATDVRVHPASRYVRERGGLKLEARIELLDQFNEPTKDVGRMVIELRLLDPNGKIILDDLGQQRGFRWSQKLTTRDEQEKYWDPIARAYVLPLEIRKPQDADLPKHRTVLVATFEPAWPDKPTLPTGERQPVEIRTDW